MAHADGGDCPTSASEAAGNARWAAARLATIANSKITTGLFYGVDGTERTYISGYDAAADRATAVLRQVGAPFPRAGPHPAAAHVEPKVAVDMRDSGQLLGVLVINNPRGVCDFPSGYSCASVLGLLLPPGARLFVWFPGAQRSVEFGGKG